MKHKKENFIETFFNTFIFSEELNPSEGELFHKFMHGTSGALSTRESIGVMAFLEEESVRIAKNHGFRGIFTTNTNPLSQQFSKKVYGYQTINEIQVNKFKAFRNAPDYQTVTICYKSIKNFAS
jgi:hypothetical protein